MLDAYGAGFGFYLGKGFSMLIGVKEKTCQQQSVLHHARVTGHGWELAYGLRVHVDKQKCFIACTF